MNTRLFILQRAFLVLVITIFLCGIGVSLWQRGGHLTERVLPEKVIVGMKEYRLEIADTNEERSLGLGRRAELCPSCAMFFLFDTEAKYGFWMAEMRFPIDIMWLDGDTVVHIERRISPQSTEVYFPPRNADGVLEVNAGDFDDIDVGERVTFLFSQT